VSEVISSIYMSKVNANLQNSRILGESCPFCQTTNE
jgi:hypothetical protein